MLLEWSTLHQIQYRSLQQYRCNVAIAEIICAVWQGLSFILVKVAEKNIQYSPICRWSEAWELQWKKSNPYDRTVEGQRRESHREKTQRMAGPVDNRQRAWIQMFVLVMVCAFHLLHDSARIYCSHRVTRWLIHHCGLQYIIHVTCPPRSSFLHDETTRSMLDVHDFAGTSLSLPAYYPGNINFKLCFCWLSNVTCSRIFVYPAFTLTR